MRLYAAGRRRARNEDRGCLDATILTTAGKTCRPRRWRTFALGACGTMGAEFRALQEIEPVAGGQNSTVTNEIGPPAYRSASHGVGRVLQATKLWVIFQKILRRLARSRIGSGPGREPRPLCGARSCSGGPAMRSAFSIILITMLSVAAHGQAGKPTNPALVQNSVRLREQLCLDQGPEAHQQSHRH
jgi:hypothetical protein